MALYKHLLAAVALSSMRGVELQPVPWPPLVTACTVMPHIAADMTAAAGGQLTCVSSGWPDCDTINCNVLSNSEQLEIELLPCWEHPALWLRARDINGKQILAHIFYKDEIFKMNVGREAVTLNVTIIQRSRLTLGVEVMALTENTSVRLIPYRDIPLNTSFCSEETPLTCEVLEFIEQYIIVENSARTHDPTKTPQCPRPDSAHCLGIDCGWPPNPYHSMLAKLELLPCVQPTGVLLTVSNSRDGVYFNHTFQQSEIVKFNSEVNLNVTLTHPQEGVIGLEVVTMTAMANLTQVSFVRIPLPRTFSKSPGFLLDSTRVKMIVMAALQSLHGQVGMSLPVDVLCTHQTGHDIPAVLSTLRVPFKELDRVWSALTLLGSYDGKLCVFHVHQHSSSLLSLAVSSRDYPFHLHPQS